MSYESPAKHLLKIISDNYNAPTSRKRDAGSSLISALHSHLQNGDIAIVDLKTPAEPKQDERSLSEILDVSASQTQQKLASWEYHAGNRYYASGFDVKEPDSVCKGRNDGTCLYPQEIYLKKNTRGGYVMDRDNPEKKQYNGPYHKACANKIVTELNEAEPKEE